MAPANSSHKAPSKARQVTKTVSKPRGAYGSREYRNWHPLKQKLRLVAIDDAVVKLIEANKAGKKYRAAKELAAEIRKAGFSDVTERDISNAKSQLLSGKRKRHSKPAQAAAPSPAPKRKFSKADLPLVSKAGRPKGSTKAAKQRLEKAKEAVKVECANAYREALDAKVSDRLEKGYLESLIRDVSAKHNVPDGAVTKGCIESRVRRNQLQPLRKGKPAIAALEDTIVLYLVALADANHPYTQDEALALTNGFIEGTEWEDVVEQYKLTHCRGSMTQRSELRKLGKAWFAGFLGRHDARLAYMKGEKFSSNRADWMVYANFEWFYHDFYGVLVKAGVAVECEPYFADRDGNVVDEDDPKRVGLKIKYRIIHPEYVLFADETGINTNQKEDKHSLKLLCRRGSTPKLTIQESNHRATVIPWTAATGECVNCTIIFESDNGHIPEAWCRGIDLRVAPENRVFFEDDDAADIESNSGPGKIFPGGPKCRFNGKDVPTMFFATPKGSVTDNILWATVKQFDRLELFDRNVAIPVILQDGHQSRISELFISYTLQEATRFYATLGIPQCTNKWQNGDAPEENGAFKYNMMLEKDDLVKFKHSKGLPIGFAKTDIVPLVNKAWAKSFAIRKNLVRALADRGLNPCNYCCLTDPDILATKDNADPDGRTEEETALIERNLETLNDDAPTSRKAHDLLYQKAKRVELQSNMRAENMKDGEEIKKACLQATRLTAGVWVKHGGFVLNEILLAALRERRQRREAKAAATEANKENTNDKRLALARQGFGAWKSDLEKWSTEELNGLYQLVKDPKLDKGAAPKHHEGLLNKLQTIQRRYIRDDRVWPPSIVTAVITNETAV